MKYEWRKCDKKLYIPKTEPEITNLESYNYIVVDGTGNPNSESFQNAIEALYALSYTIKMSLKKSNSISDFYDYTVFPLEGIWDLTEEGKEMFQEGSLIIDIKDHLKYQLMIRQPEFVTKNVFDSFLEPTFKKKKNDLIMKARFYESPQETVCQCLHIGSYDLEPATFAKMESFCNQNNYKRESKIHTEIYLSDARKTAVEKLKTTLRFKVVEA